MQNFCIYDRLRFWRRQAVLLVIASLLIAPHSQAVAIEVATLFTAQVPLDPEEQNPRTHAYETALNDVLLRVSGSELATDPDLIDAIFPDPAAYVVQFRPGPDETLWVSFDGEAVEDALRNAGQTVWGSERPLTLVWLAVDWGQGEREILGATDAERSMDEARSIDRDRLLRQRVLDIAERRGLPVVFPLLDTEDFANVSFADIWGGFDEAVIAASERYDADSVLIGRIRPETGQRNRWTYHFGDQQQSWSGEPELVVALVADRLAGEFAIRGDAPLRTVELNVAGVTSVDAYGRIQRMLSDLSIIDDFAVVRVEGDQILYRISTRGGAERLARALRFNGLIEQERLDTGQFDDFSSLSTLDFFYSP